MNCEVSIIIPTFNRPNLLVKTIDSIIAQSFKFWECIIIDDGSNAENVEVLKEITKKDSRICYYSRPHSITKGPSGCRNYGLTKSNGTYIQFFDDDDIMYPEMIFEKIKLIKNTKSDVVVAPLDFYDVVHKKKVGQNKVYSKNLIVDYVMDNVSWYVSGPIWSRDFMIEEFDVSIQTLDDWDFNLRNIYKKPKISFIDFPLQKYNRYGLGKTLSTLGQIGNSQQIESLFFAYRKHYMLLKRQNILTKILHQHLFNRVVFLLRESLVNRQVISKDLYNFLIENFSVRDGFKISKIIMGYYSYKFFGKGYSFFTLNK